MKVFLCIQKLCIRRILKVIPEFRSQSHASSIRTFQIVFHIFLTNGSISNFRVIICMHLKIVNLFYYRILCIPHMLRYQLTNFIHKSYTICHGNCDVILANIINVANHHTCRNFSSPQIIWTIYQCVLFLDKYYHTFNVT